jgi:hypothetical protein
VHLAALILIGPEIDEVESSASLLEYVEPLVKSLDVGPDFVSMGGIPYA